MQSFQTSPVTPSVAAPGVDRSAPAVDSAASDRELREETHRADGIVWTCLPTAPPLLDRIPAEAWRDPAGQPGWRCVKRNAARQVWRIRTEAGVFYAKYFREHDWRARAKAVLGRCPCRDEWTCLTYALRAGIRAPRPVALTHALGGGGPRRAVLITEAIEPSAPLDEYWLELRETRGRRRRQGVRELCETLAELIAHAHQAGLEHVDMHAANIVVCEQRGASQAAFVDLQSARLGAALPDEAVVRNLAQLNQWFRRHASLADRLRFLRAYLRWRLEYEQLTPFARPLRMSFRELYAALNDAADRHARQLWRRRDRRIGRAKKYFVTLRFDGWRGVAVRRRRWTPGDASPSRAEYDRDWLRSALGDPAALLKQPTCKDSHSAAVAIAVLEAGRARLEVVVKRPLARNAQRRIRQLFPPSRARRGWRIGHALLNRNIPAAMPLALLERRAGPFVLDQMLVTELIPDALDLPRHFQRERADRSRRSWSRHKRALAEAIGRFVRTLHDRGFVHRDCKAENLLVAPGPRLYWIDFDGIRLRRRVGRADRLAAMARLHVSLLDSPYVSITDRARCLRAYYRGFGRDPRAWRDAWRRLAPLVERKVRQREARRAWKRAHYGRE